MVETQRPKKRVRWAEQTEVVLLPEADCHGPEAGSDHDAQHTSMQPPIRCIQFVRSTADADARGSSSPSPATAAAAAAAVLEDEDGGPGGVAGSSVAAACARRRFAMRCMPQLEDTAVLEDVEAAEEEDDEPDERFNEAGVPIEPFNLTRERQEGYFDAEGNYIPYQFELATDAWLDALGDGPVEVSKAEQARLLAHGDALALVAGGVEDAEAGAQLDEDDIAIYKKRIIDLLLPGETVLRALRRLAGMGGGGTGSGRGGGDAGQAAALRGKPAQQRKRLRATPAGIGGGSIGADEPMGWEGPEGGDGPAAGPAAAAGAQGALGAAAGTPPAAAAGAAGGAHSGPAAAGSPRQRRLPPAAAAAFDRLTEYADQLLAAGLLDIYSTPREQLLQRLADDQALVRQLGEELAALRRDEPPEALDGAVEGAEGVAAAGAGGGSPGAMAGGGGPAAAAVAVAGEEARVAVDADVDMFGAEEAAAAGNCGSAVPMVEGGGVSEGGGDAAAVAAASASGAAMGAAGVPMVAEAGDSCAAPAAQQVGLVAQGWQPSGKGGAEAAGEPAEGSGIPGQAAAAAGPGAPLLAASAVPPPQQLSAMDGFELQSNGYFYSSALGYYYDPATQLFGDAGTGLWFRYVDGCYQEVA